LHHFNTEASSVKHDKERNFEMLGKIKLLTARFNKTIELIHTVCCSFAAIGVEYRFRSASLFAGRGFTCRRFFHLPILSAREQWKHTRDIDPLVGRNS
jgi:hypothetical protein